MRNLTTILSLLVLLTPATAQAKRIDKLSTGQLISELKNSSKPERRIEAAQRLAETGAREATAVLGGICSSAPPEAVCVAAIEALDALGTSEALTHIQKVLELKSAPTSGRSQALAVLMKSDEPRLRESIPRLFKVYSDIPPSLLSELMVSTRLLELTDLADAAVFIASDENLDLGARLAALDTAEQFGPARLYQAHQALMRAKDSKVRARCAEALGSPGLPASEVVPLLKQVVRLDPEGYVRAAAINALSQYT
ncbi:MAG: HEAT repeat domain-containing protein, partial [Myxococcota bacterium]|nr:HEAT repeat domain-containing protein [Myxococcota bacterium]